MRHILLWKLLLLLSVSVFGQQPSDLRIKPCGYDDVREEANNLFAAELASANKQFEIFQKSSKGQALKDNSNIVTIPIVFHIVHNGEPIGSGPNFSEAQLEQAVDFLNYHYQQLTPNKVTDGFSSSTPDTRFRFCLAKTTPFGTNEPAITRSFGSDYYTHDSDNPSQQDFLIKRWRWDPTVYLNIYITDLRVAGYTDSLYGIGGYSSFPEAGTINQGITPEENNNISGLIDGVVMNYRYLEFDSDYVGPNLEVAFVHEVGHWLGLFHNFNKFECQFYNTGRVPECDEYGDLICDTPILEMASRDFNPSVVEWPNRVPSCPGPMVSAQNHMDYSENTTFFTPGQIERMHQITQFYRPDIYTEKYRNADCTIDIDLLNGPSGGGSGSGSGTWNGSNTDPYGFKIRTEYSGSFGNSVSNDGNIIVIADRNNKKAHLFKIKDNCEVQEDQILQFSGAYQFADHVYTKENKVFVTVDNAIMLFEENANDSSSKGLGEWSATQIIPNPNGNNPDFGGSILLRNDELLVTSQNHLVLYKYNGNSYVKQWDSYSQEGVRSYDNDGLAYNGDFIILKVKDFYYPSYRFRIYYKDESGNFQAYLYKFIDSLTGRIALSDSPENKLYTTGISFDSPYDYLMNVWDLNSFNPLNEELPSLETFNLPNDYYSENDWISKILISNNLMILPRGGDGVSFHNRNLPTQGISINDGDLNDRFLRPSPYALSESLGLTSSFDGNFLVVGNLYVNEIYIYNVSKLVFEDENYQFCDSPTGNYISGKKITLGNGSCQLNLDSDKGTITFKASDKIKINASSKIKGNVKFLVGENCSLTGGLLIPTEPNTALKAHIKGGLKNGISKVRLQEGDLIISPNPFDDVLEITSVSELVNSVQVKSITNQRVLQYQNPLNSPQIKIDLSYLPTGVYIIVCEMKDNSVVTKQIIKR